MPSQHQKLQRLIDFYKRGHLRKRSIQFCLYIGPLLFKVFMCVNKSWKFFRSVMNNFWLFALTIAKNVILLEKFDKNEVDVIELSLSK